VIEPKFLDVLRVEERTRVNWLLLAELRFDSAVLGARIIVPEGFITDFASHWMVRDVGRKAAVIHDHLYHSHIARDRALADAVYYEALRVEGVPLWKAWAMHLAVRWRGWTRW
jgi:hypothetical protein